MPSSAAVRDDLLDAGDVCLRVGARRFGSVAGGDLGHRQPVLRRHLRRRMTRHSVADPPGVEQADRAPLLRQQVGAGHTGDARAEHRDVEGGVTLAAAARAAPARPRSRASSPAARQPRERQRVPEHGEQQPDRARRSRSPWWR